MPDIFVAEISQTPFPRPAGASSSQTYAPATNTKCFPQAWQDPPNARLRREMSHERPLSASDRFLVTDSR
jgi:hypothetical protein